ncbi:MAG TPA: aminotransferase class V-fold PLP-dependent enzyme [Thermoleophilaceae bacterium]|nr:aminotransferase class V-fold PLP-dependent enzyme [Thermoleophilaceae bacterium]
MDVAALRAQLPVLERLAYLNAGSVGPVPRAAVEAAEADLRLQAEHGRGGKAHFDHALALADRLRARVAGLLRCDPWEVALTGATTDGVNAVLAGLDLRAGDEIVTSDEEHPGLLAPLGLARARRGVEVRIVPFAEVAGAVGPRTRLVACSHVSWIDGRVADTAALAACPAPVLLDGAQGLGAVPVDVRALGCDYYAASGQKWLCGPIGSGYLYVREELIDALSPAWPGYGSLSDPLRAIDLPYVAGAARFDGGFPPSHQTAWALAALDVLEGVGLDALTGRAALLATRLAELLTTRGLTVAERGRSTLVSWEATDPQADSARLLDAGFLVRDLPGTPYVRASVGGWTSDDEIERLADVAAASPR